MKYEVIIMPAAQGELEEAYRWLAAETPQHAPLWYNGVLDAMYSLEELPARCPVAPESGDSGEEIRQLVYGNKRHAYRILFSIRNDTVLIVHIRNAARDRP
ncbi:MAG TPA: type II toxin-antitoxin system RelE/ParE family toxin [Phycisphaerae bacterium]|nr:type II toxin-antitoxin system RelE/ParE family toxin [Phycisphaerae bacterium]